MKRIKRLSALVLTGVTALSLAACGKKEEEQTPATPVVKVPASLKDANDYIKTICNQQIDAQTLADYTVLKSYVGDADVNVVWTVSVTQGNASDVQIVTTDTEVKVDLNEYTDHEIKYTLSYTLTKGDDTFTYSFEKTVPAFHVATRAEYVAACTAKTAVTVKGRISSIISPKTNSSITNKLVYVQDADGYGYYGYGLSTDPVDDGFEVGDEVFLSGTGTIYNGTYELENCALAFVNAEAAAVPVTPKDITSLVAAAADNKATALTDLQGSYVEIKGVKIGACDKTTKYYNFSLGNVESYIRPSDSSGPLNSTQYNAIYDALNAKKYYTTDMKGIVCQYSRVFYLLPVDTQPYSTFTAPVYTDKEALEVIHGDYTFVDHYCTAQNAVQLDTSVVASNKTVNVSWALKETSAYASITDNKITTVIPTDADQTITLVATFSCGEETPKTKEFTVKLEKTNIMAATAINALTKDGTVVFAQGIVTNYNSKYKSCYLDDNSGETAYVYGWLDKDNINVKNGDYITIRGLYKNYNGTDEIEKCELVSQASAVELDASVEENQHAIVAGWVKSIDDATNGGITIETEDGSKSLVIASIRDKEGEVYSSEDYAGIKNIAVGKYVTLDVKKTASGYEDGFVLKMETKAKKSGEGTESSPWNVAKCLDELGKLNLADDGKAFTANEIVVAGYVKSASYYDDGKKMYKVYIADSMDSNTTFLVYNVFYEDVANKGYVGDFITVKGYAKNYKGTLEVDTYTDAQSVDHNAAILGTTTHGTTTVETEIVDADGKVSTNATIGAFTAVGTNGQSFSAEITAAQGYKVTVKQGGSTIAVSNVANTYNFVYGQGKITVVVEEEVQGVTVTFNPSAGANKYGVGSVASGTNGGNTEVSGTITEGTITLNYVKLKDNGYKYLMVANGGYLYNASALSTEIVSVKIVSTSGAAAAAKLTVNFGTSALSTKVGNTSADTSITGSSQSVTFTNTVAGAKYFQIENISSKNCQIEQIVIVCKVAQ